jgi:hypothetical protein
MILTDSRVGSLKAALNCWEWFGYISTAIVFIGCVGEFIAEFTSLPKTEESKHKLARLSLIVLIVGIAGELLSTVRTSQLSGQLIANIEERASANEREAAQLRRDAEQLRKDAETEHLARVKIEARVAWRHLTDKQKSDIGTRLGDFSNQEGASFWYQTGDTEAAMFAIDIAEALQAAHIVVQPPADMTVFHGSGKFGDPIKRIDTGVTLQSTKDARSRALAEAVIRELTLRGFDARRQTDPPFDDRPIPQVWLNVWPRPEGPQGEFKLEAEGQAKVKEQAQSTQVAK